MDNNGGFNLDYFDQEFRDDKLNIRRLDSLIEQSLATLAATHVNGEWPYHLSSESVVTIPSNLSLSTQSMVLFSLAGALGTVSVTDLIPCIPSQPQGNVSSSVRKSVNAAFGKGIASTLRRMIVPIASTVSDHILPVRDSSMGPYNPLTLSWLIPVWAGEAGRVPCTTPADISTSRLRLIALGNWAKLAARRLDAIWSKPGEPVFLEDVNATSHALPALRTYRLQLLLEWIRDDAAKSTSSLLAKLLGNGWTIPRAFRLPLDSKARSSVREWFCSRVYEHLAYARIPDAPFDAAELAHSLEGYLLCCRKSADSLDHDAQLVAAAFDTLQERQDANPYWRPLKPLATDERGRALLPLSVEIVNSLFRSCELLGPHGDAAFSRHIDVFKRYYDWVNTRKISLRCHVGSQSVEATGWHSEHVQSRDCIHVWETSQVLCYLMQYRDMLQRHLARRALDAAHLHTVRLKRDAITDEERKAAKLLPDADVTGSEYWEIKVRDSKDPGPPARSLYEDVRRQFIAPREGAVGRTSYSAVLYGPPGTGKTTIAEDLARSLQWDFVEITPSDFVASGEAAVELRAKEIFEALGEQRKVVVLFDEIDRLILDRDSLLYSKQGDMFQVVTPGMLPKLKSLRKQQQSIFLLATNYEERLDPAAIRVGRIDTKLLVGLPNLEARTHILLKEAKEEVSRFSLSLDSDLAASDLNSTARIACLSSYGELCEIVRKAVSTFYGSTGTFPKATLLAELENTAAENPPAVRVSTYASRFRVTHSGRGQDFPATREPVEEFLGVLGLVAEANTGKVGHSDKECATAVMVGLCAEYSGKIDSKDLRKSSESRVAELLTVSSLKSSTEWLTFISKEFDAWYDAEHAAKCLAEMERRNGGSSP